MRRSIVRKGVFEPHRLKLARFEVPRAGYVLTRIELKTDGDASFLVRMTFSPADVVPLTSTCKVLPSFVQWRSYGRKSPTSSTVHPAASKCSIAAVTARCSTARMHDAPWSPASHLSPIMSSIPRWHRSSAEANRRRAYAVAPQSWARRVGHPLLVLLCY